MVLHRVLVLYLVSALLAAHSSGSSLLLRYRGGSALPLPLPLPALSPIKGFIPTDHPSPMSAAKQSVTVMVTVAAGARFLNRQKLLRIHGEQTIGELKDILSKQFPGYPPRSLQRLYLGSRLLGDAEIICEVTDLSPAPLTLDLLSGTGAYNRSTLSVSDALESFAALEVHILANAMLQAELMTNVTGANAPQLLPMPMRLSLYRDLFIKENSSIYKTFSHGISKALVAEQNPELESADTAAWRKAAATASELSRARDWGLSRALHMSSQELQAAAGTSALLFVYAHWAASTLTSKYVTLTAILMYWISRLRAARLFIKTLRYFILPQLVGMPFILPLVSTPDQILAEFFSTFLNGNPTGAEDKLRSISLGDSSNVDSSRNGGLFPPGEVSSWRDDLRSVFERNADFQSTYKVARDAVSPLIRSFLSSSRNRINARIILDGELEEVVTASTPPKKQKKKRFPKPVKQILRDYHSNKKSNSREDN